MDDVGLVFSLGFRNYFCANTKTSETLLLSACSTASQSDGNCPIEDRITHDGT